jgi:putative DNA primase/helicase
VGSVTLPAELVLHAEEIFGRDAADDKLSEAGAAERFTRHHGADLRFDHRRQSWLIRERHWWRSDVDAAVLRIGLEFSRAWQLDGFSTIADRERREAVIKFALQLERRDKLTNMLAIARALKPIADAGEGWDADPWLLACDNGVIDLQRGQLRPGRPDDRIRMHTAVRFDAAATCPRWEQFVSEIFAGDQALMTFVQRAVGYSVTGITTEQVLFLLFGTGSNGKGTFVNTLKRALGDYAWNMPFATIEMRDRCAIPNDVAALLGRRFVIASETNDGTRLNEARVKALTGCDPVTARFLHGEFFTFEPIAKFWLSVNHKPIVRDDSHGFWRRLRLIPFTQRFPVNRALGDELAAEASGILSWAVRGCLDWQREGLDPPAVVTDATAAYERDSDPLAAFLAEGCDLDPEAEVGAADLFEHYKRWAEQQGLTERERLSSTALGRKVGERFHGQRTKAGKVYLGLARRQW